MVDTKGAYIVQLVVINNVALNTQKIIDACKEHNVVIEVNANPRRLDMPWEWVDNAMEKGVMLSINPDAHELSEYEHCRYGVLAAQKGGLTKERNLSSFSLKVFEKFLARQYKKR